MKEMQGKSTLVRVSAGGFELSVVNCTKYQTLDGLLSVRCLSVE